MFEELLAEANEGGWRVNQFHQDDEGLWYCNLRKWYGNGGLYTEVGKAWSAMEALLLAIEYRDLGVYHEYGDPSPPKHYSEAEVKAVNQLRAKLLPQRGVRRV